MSLINFYNLFIHVNNFKLRPETIVDRDHAHQSGQWTRWFGVFGIDFSSKLTWILFIISNNHRKFYMSLSFKRKIVKKLPLLSALDRTRFTQPSFERRLVGRISVYRCLWSEFEVIDIKCVNGLGKLSDINKLWLNPLLILFFIPSIIL
jgi:hypothetical protein